MMIKNLKTMISLILIILTLLLIIFSSLATSKLSDQASIKDDLASFNAGASTYLGMVLYNSQVDNYIDVLLSNGFNQLRIDIPDYQSRPEADGQAAVKRAIDRGAKVIWGVSSNSFNNPAYTITSSNWPNFRQAILDAARWAQDNGVYEFQLGNEEEYHIDGTTMTVDQIITNLKSVAIEAQTIFTRGNISYSCAHSYISNWVATGKGEIDLLASNIYMGYGDWKTDLWKTEIDTLISAFGPDGTYITEFSLNNKSLATFSSDEAEQAAAVSTMLKYIETSGMTRALFYCLNGDTFGIVKADGNYRQLWSVLASHNKDTNTPPEVKDLFISPEDPMASDDLTANYNYNDEEGALECSSQIRWYKNDELQPLYDDIKVISLDDSDKNDTWYFTVSPSDGITYGELKVSSSVKVRVPEIFVSPISINFDSKDINEMADSSRTLIITNTGTADLLVGTISITGKNSDQFVKSDHTILSQTIAPGESKLFTVIFNPSTEGLKTAILSISSNDKDEPITSIKIFGLATDDLELSNNKSDLAIGIESFSSETDYLKRSDTIMMVYNNILKTTSLTHYSDWYSITYNDSNWSLAAALNSLLGITTDPKFDTDLVSNTSSRSIDNKIVNRSRYEVFLKNISKIIKIISNTRLKLSAEKFNKDLYTIGLSVAFGLKEDSVIIFDIFDIINVMCPGDNIIVARIWNDSNTVSFLVDLSVQYYFIDKTK